ncbi:MAG: peptidoglycan DD-metalloendopeptidase family protein [Saprospiraceae bacterium]
MLLLVGLFASNGYGQQRNQLELERKQLQKEIALTNKKLAQAKKNRASALNNYLLVKRQVEKRRQLIEVYQKDLESTTANIERTEAVINDLTTDLSRLQKEYSKIMQAALRSKLQQSYLVFLFSSDNLNDAFRRLQYLRQYDKYRQRQSQLILYTQQSLQTKADRLNTDKLKKDSLLSDLLSQNNQLATELSDKNKLLNGLQSEEKKLARTLDQKEKAAKKLNQLIENTIKKEILAASPKETKSNSKSTTTPKENAIDIATSGSFNKARGRLPWPVSQGEISKAFGLNYHPKFKNVKTTNNGIDISTNKDAAVKAVFDGKVVGVQFIPGYKNTVIIKHGRYYTVYSNLSSIYVKRNDQVKAQQNIGKLSAGEPELHFEVWRGKDRLNPTSWIIKK